MLRTAISARQKKPRMEKYERDKRWLFWANLAAAAFHWISFIAALIVSLVFSDRVYRATVTFTTLEDVGAGVIGPVLRVVGRYRLTGTLLPVPALTASFHTVLALVPFIRSDYEAITLNGGRPGAGYNLYRWIEYSLSASLVTWNVAQVSGVSEIFVLLALIALNAWMQIDGGGVFETRNIGWPARRPVTWWFFLWGFVPFVLTWAAIWTSFGFGVASSTETVPAFVWALVVGIFVQYCLFVVPILLHYNGWLLRDNVWYEMSYIALSFTSKFYLDWVLIIGSITR